MSLRHSLALLILAFTVEAASAQGADPAADWRGGYFGLSAGAVRTEGAASRDGFTGALIGLDVENGLFPARQDDSDLSPALGVGLGYNLQRGALVWGVELDFMLLTAEVAERFSRVDPNPAAPFTGVLTQTGYDTEIDNLATLRLRAGVAQGRSVFYGTAGLAAGRVANRFSLDLPNLVWPPLVPAGYSNSWSDAGTRFGWVVGAGFERRLSAATSFKAELLHFDLEDVTIRAEDPGVFGDNTIDYRFANDGQVLRLWLNVRF